MTKKSILLLAIFLLAASCVKTHTPTGEHLQVGERLPSFSAVTVDGKAVSDESLIGTPSVVVLFDSTCPDCHRQLPEIQRLKDASSGSILFLAISRNDDAQTVRRYWADNGYTIDVVPKDGQGLFDLFDRGSRSGVPQVYFCEVQNTVTAYYDQYNLYRYEQ
jgi:thiol-disulfide isomerase/thioredoxin